MESRILTLLTLFYFIILIVLKNPSEAQEPRTIDKWADEFGDELWSLGLSVSKVSELTGNYKTLNARVQEKDGKSLLNSIIDNVGRMLKWKIDAVQCIKTAAEDLAEKYEFEDFANYSYYNSKYSPVNGEKPFEFHDFLNMSFYAPMNLTPDNQFYNIPINMSYSSVHIPTNVYDLAADVLSHIQWSEKLDEVFIQNYKSDPSLSWQYFGGSSGFQRNYPALQWNQSPDLYDCRNRFWYIEAATCSKDVVILLDTTGSMKGMRLNIAKLTVNTILDTMGSNDYINVLNFSHTAQEVVPCYKDILVQATAENVQTFKNAVKELEIEGFANFSKAFMSAFELLEKHRQIRGCNNITGIECNQAIMLVTDSVAGNITDVFNKYNSFDNGTNIPVRVFSFLVGHEVTKVMEIMWMACLNRGFYVHILSLAEVREQVFKYIPVIARPLILQGIVHPIVWTHVYADIRDPKLGKWLWDVMESDTDQQKRLSKHFDNKELYFSQRKEDNLYSQSIFKAFREPDKLRYQEYKLITSVSIPTFNRKLNYEFDNYTDVPDLLGVCGTDVPIEDIEKLTFPYKIGVNGYAFIVTNNGYMLLHPDLRPVSRGVLKDNYNSIDLTEVELLDDTRYPRELSPEILELREAMVNNSAGEILGLKMKYHYDDMRRVGVEYRDFYYAPLKGTPFSIAITLPKDYGKVWLKVSNEIKKSKLRGKPLLNFFQGENWRVYSKWVYCKYFYASLYPFESPELELRHFLDKISTTKFKWQEQYRKDYDEYEFEDDIEEDGFIEMMKTYNESKSCNKEERGTDEYYCDKDLMQLLVFDAKITSPTFHDDKWLLEDNEENDLARLYRATARFLATQSGLTRWQDIMESEEDGNRTSEFGDLHSDAIDEPWYKSAVLQYMVHPESFVFSVPFDAGTKDDSLVTASYAVFPHDGGLETPAAVVGLQFQHSALHARFMSITSKANCPTCEESCSSEELDCFVLDHNGYVIISENHNDTGRFFGEIEGAVMEALMNANIYKKNRIYDYQALCFDERPKTPSAADMLWTPVHHLKLFVNWVFGEIVWLLFQSNLGQIWYGFWVSANPMDSPIVEGDYYDYDTPEITTEEEEQTEAGIGDDLNATEITHEPCDQKTNLYLLQPEVYKSNGYCHTGANAMSCSRPFCMKRIPHSNLVMIVVDTMHQSCYKKLSSSPKQLQYNNVTHPCQKLQLNYLPRRRLVGCFTEHSKENTKHMCGKSMNLNLSFSVLFITWIVVLLGRAISST